MKNATTKDSENIGYNKKIDIKWIKVKIKAVIIIPHFTPKRLTNPFCMNPLNNISSVVPTINTMVIINNTKLSTSEVRKKASISEPALVMSLIISTP